MAAQGPQMATQSPQPNFDKIAEGLSQFADGVETVTNNVAKFRNIPFVAASNAILTAIQSMEQRLEQRLEQMEQNNKQTARELQQLILASNTNNVARIYNSQLPFYNLALMPLHNVTTNRHLHNFPPTAIHIDHLESAQVEDFLDQLHANFEGEFQMKIQHLRVLIGLKAVPM